MRKYRNHERWQVELDSVLIQIAIAQHVALQFLYRDFPPLADEVLGSRNFAQYRFVGDPVIHSQRGTQSTMVRKWNLTELLSDALY